MAVVFSFSFSQPGVAKIGNSWGSGREEYTFLQFFRKFEFRYSSVQHRKQQQRNAQLFPSKHKQEN